MRRIAVATAAVLCAGLLAVPPRHPVELSPAPYLVMENRAVVVAPGVSVALGTPVERLPSGVSLEAYDPASRAGIAQWGVRTQAPVLLLLHDAVVRAISVAFEPRFRTSAGVGMGDPEERLRAAYGRGLRESADSGYAIGSAADAATYFDTACTNRVNAIGLALGVTGIRLLESLWQAPAGVDGPC